MPGSLVITNIGSLLTGDLARPRVDADTITVTNGRITDVGTGGDVGDDTPELDVDGATVIPGLVDNHVHTVFGDWTPRQHQTDFLAGFVHGGVTRVISAGEVHLPGRPKDRAGAKALAVLARKAFANLRPNGLRIHGGAVLLEPGLTEQDFLDMAAEGVHLVGEIGISSVRDPDEAAEMTGWAQAAGMTVTAHFGGKSVPTSRPIDGAFVTRVRPDVAAHANGGPTAPSMDDVRLVLDETGAAIEVVHNGNVRAARDIAHELTERDALDRLVVGTDSPAGTGVVPLGVLRVLSWLCALGGLDAGQAVAAGSGNTMRARGLDGGTVEEGALADLVVVDAPAGSQADDFATTLAIGDTPAVAAVVVDGEVVLTSSRNTPPPQHAATLRN